MFRKGPPSGAVHRAESYGSVRERPVTVKNCGQFWGEAMLVSEKQLTSEQSRMVATTVREEIARRRMSRQQLADRAKISISTLEKALSGRRPFTLGDHDPPGRSARRRLAEIRSTNGSRDDRAFKRRCAGRSRRLCAAFGAVDRGHLSHHPAVLRRARCDLCLSHRHRLGRGALQPDLSRVASGSIPISRNMASVAVPNQSGHIYLVTNRHGQYRLITVARPTITGEMHGILTTLLAGRGSQLTPIAAPIAFVPLRAESACTDRAIALRSTRIATTSHSRYRPSLKYRRLRSAAPVSGCDGIRSRCSCPKRPSHARVDCAP